MLFKVCKIKVYFRSVPQAISGIFLFFSYFSSFWQCHRSCFKEKQFLLSWFLAMQPLIMGINSLGEVNHRFNSPFLSVDCSENVTLLNQPFTVLISVLEVNLFLIRFITMKGLFASYRFLLTTLSTPQVSEQWTMWPSWQSKSNPLDYMTENYPPFCTHPPHTFLLLPVLNT